MRTKEELLALLNEAHNMENFSGMTYKDGVIAALEYVLKIGGDEKPTE